MGRHGSRLLEQETERLPHLQLQTGSRKRPESGGEALQKGYTLSDSIPVGPRIFKYLSQWRTFSFKPKHCVFGASLFSQHSLVGE